MPFFRGGEKIRFFFIFGVPYYGVFHYGGFLLSQNYRLEYFFPQKVFSGSVFF
jgi:hypothetical protein